MGGSAGPQTPKTDYKRDITQFVAGLQQSFPKVLGTEGKYRNDFTGLNLGDVSNMLGGTKGQKGIFALGGQLANQSGRQLNKARGNELRQMQGQSGNVRSLFQTLSPESAKMVEYANQNAINAQKAAQGLTGGEARSAQQFAREGAADRGRVMDNSAMAAEVLNRDSILGQKRQEAYGATQNAYNLANSFYTQPGLQALSSVPNSYQAGQNYLGIGLNSIGSAKPQLIDIGAGLNLGASNRQNQFASAAAKAEADAKQQQAYIQAGSAVGGAAGGAYAGAAYGSAAGPYGTAIGAIVGGAAGYFAGS